VSVCFQYRRIDTATSHAVRGNHVSALIVQLAQLVMAQTLEQVTPPSRQVGGPILWKGGAIFCAAAWKVGGYNQL
jgi:hypothetical protein